MYAIYRHLAAVHHLHLSPDDPGMMTFLIDLTGSVDGHPIHVRRYCGRGAHVVVSSPLAPHLDLGFGLSRHGLLATIGAWLGKKDIQVGDPTFDEAFEIRGDEPSRVQALLPPAARAELASLRLGDFKITDAEFSTDFSASGESYGLLETVMRDAVRAARIIEQARLTVPPASALRAHHDAWMSFAREHGWRAESTPLWIGGKWGTAEAFARGVRKDADDYDVEVVLWLDTPPAQRFVVEPKRTGLDKFASGAGIPTGDAAFDGVFDVRLGDSDRVGSLLDPSVRSRLVSLSAIGSVSLHDHRATLHADASALDPAKLGPVLEEMRGILETLRKNQEGPGAAYR